MQIVKVLFLLTLSFSVQNVWSNTLGVQFGCQPYTKNINENYFSETNRRLDPLARTSNFGGMGRNEALTYAQNIAPIYDCDPNKVMQVVSQMNGHPVPGLSFDINGDLPSQIGQRPLSYGDLIDPYADPMMPFNRVSQTLSGPTSNNCPNSSAGNSFDLGQELDEDTIELINDELGARPSFISHSSGDDPISTALPSVEAEDVMEKGYYRYTDEDSIFYGTERTIWNIEATGLILAEQGIAMGVGDISKEGGGSLRPTHGSHQTGRDIDVRFIGPTDDDGKAISSQAGCRVDQACYDADNTYKMLKAFIDADPEKIEMILINDRDLIGRVNTYYEETYGEARNIGVWDKDENHCDHAHIRYNNE